MTDIQDLFYKLNNINENIINKLVLNQDLEELLNAKSYILKDIINLYGSDMNLSDHYTKMLSHNTTVADVLSINKKNVISRSYAIESILNKLG